MAGELNDLRSRGVDDTRDWALKGMPNYVDENVAAEIISCSPGLLRKWRRLGEGPVYCKIGRLVRYSLTDIQSFLDGRRVKTADGDECPNHTR